MAPLILMMINRWWSKAKKWFRLLGNFQKERALALTRLECAELENVFALLLIGSFIGLPAPPSFLALELIPLMEREIQVFHKRASESDDMLSQILGVFGID